MLKKISIIEVIIIISAILIVASQMMAIDFRLNEATMINCAMRSIGELLSFGYGQPCCCSLDHQPGYSMGLKMWSSLFGFSKPVLKGFSLLFYILAIITLFRIGRDSFERKYVGSLFGLSFVLNYFLIEIGQYIYMYIHYFFFCVLAAYFLNRKNLHLEIKIRYAIYSLGIGSLFFYMGYFYFWTLVFVCFIYRHRDGVKIPKVFVSFMSILFILKTPVIFLFRFVDRDTQSYEYTFGKVLYSAQQLIFGGQTNTSVEIIFKLILIGFGVVAFYYYLKNDQNIVLKTYVGISSIVSGAGFIFLSLVLRLDEIKPMYFLFYIFVFHFVVFYLLDKISLKSVQYKVLSIMVALIYFGMLSTGLVKGVLLEKSQLTKNAVFDMKYKLVDYKKFILFSEYDTEYYMSGLYRSYFDENIKLIHVDEKDLCKERGDFFLLDSHNPDGRVKKELKEKDCFDQFQLVQKKIYHTDMHPGPWAIFEFTRNLD